MHDGMKPKDSFDKVLSNFSMPDARFAPYMFWFFDQDLDAIGIKAQEMAHELSKKGFNPGYAHARPSSAYNPNEERAHVCPLPREQWLSDKWFSVFREQVLQAETDSVHFSFTDDYSWPSLQAGGRLIEADETLKARCLSYDYTDLSKGEKIDIGECDFAVVGRLEKTEPASFVSYIEPEGEWQGDIWRSGVIEGSFVRPDDPEDTPAAWRWNHYYCDQTPPEKNDTLPFNMAAAFARDRRCSATYNLYVPKAGEYEISVCWQDIGCNTERAVYGIAGEKVECDQRENAFIWNRLGSFSMNEGVNYITVENGGDGVLSVDAIKLVSSDGEELIVDDLQKYSRVIAYLDLESLRVLEGESFEAKEDCRVYRFTAVEHRGLDFASIDYLQDRTSDLFIKECWEPYFERMKEFMGSGKTVNGIFADHEGDYGYKMAWSQQFADEFFDRYGEDIRRILPLLIDRDTKGQDAVWRFRWFDTVSEIYTRHFEKLSKKAEEYGLYYTFHVWEESLPLQAFCVGDVFRLYRALSLPGTDALHNVCFNPQNFKDFFSVAEFESVRFMDEVAALTEPEDYTPALLKKQANYLAAYGVSHVITHSLKMTRPLTQTIVPPDFYNIDPCWNAMDRYTEFLRRTSYINSLGNARADVLVLNPLDSMYVLAEHEVFTMDPTHFSGQPELCSIFGGETGEINRQYGQIIRILTRRHVEFLTADKEYVRRMERRGKEWCYRGYSFSTVVLPRSQAIDLEVAEKLRDYALAGGRLCVVGHFPSVSLQNGRGDPALAAIWQEIENLSNVSLVSEPDYLPCESAIRFTDEGDRLLCHHRMIDGRHFIFICNNSDTAVNSEMTLPFACGNAFFLRPDNGERVAAKQETSESGTSVLLSLEPTEALYLVLDFEGVFAETAEEKSVIKTMELSDFRAHIDLGDDSPEAEACFEAVNSDRLRLIIRKGSHKSPTRPSVRFAELFFGESLVSRQEINRTFAVEFDEVAEIILPTGGKTVDRVRIVSDDAVTSFRIEKWDGKWWKTVAEVDRYRQNELINEIAYHDRCFAAPLTDWSEWEFLPERFAGTVLYETTVSLSPEDITGSARLKTELSCGAVAVSVNGQPVGHAMFAPFSFEIGDKLSEGENRITLAVSNTIGSNLGKTSGGILSVSLEVIK